MHPLVDIRAELIDVDVQETRPRLLLLPGQRLQIVDRRRLAGSVAVEPLPGSDRTVLDFARLPIGALPEDRRDRQTL